jgi:hypothetical protein
VSGHNNHFLWGPGDRSAEVVITVGEPREDVEKTYADVVEAARLHHPYAMPYESFHPILVGRKRKRVLRLIWPEVKMYL